MRHASLLLSLTAAVDTFRFVLLQVRVLDISPPLKTLQDGLSFACVSPFTGSYVLFSSILAMSNSSLPTVAFASSDCRTLVVDPRRFCDSPHLRSTHEWPYFTIITITMLCCLGQMYVVPKPLT